MALPMFDKNDPRYLQLLAQMARSGNIDPMTMESQVEGALNPSGMAASGYAKDAPAPDPKGSIEGRQRISDNQRKYAQSLRGDAAPQGHTAGPLNVYYGPNWGESLAHAGKQVMGGYMEGQANKEDASIDEARQLEKALALKKAQEAIDYDRGRDDADDAHRAAVLEQGDSQFTATHGLSRDNFDEAIRNTDRSFEENVRQYGITMAENIRSAQASEAAASATLAQRLAQDNARLEFDEGKGSTKTYVGPDGPLTVIEDAQGVSWQTDADGNIDSPIDVSSMKELQETRQVNLTKAEMEALDAQSAGADNATFGITMASDIFRAPNNIWNDGTGLGLESVFTGATGMASGSEAGPAIQEFQRKVQKLGFEGMEQDFKRLDLGQIAKNEFEAVSKANANWKTEPYGLVMLQAGKIPLYEKAFNAGIKAGSHTNAQRDVHMQKMEDDVIYGATQINQKTGKPTANLAELERKGIDVSGRRAELLEKLSSDTANQEDKALLKAIIMARKAEKADS